MTSYGLMWNVSTEAAAGGEWYERFGGDVEAGPTVIGDASEFEFWHTFTTWTPARLEYRSDSDIRTHIYWHYDGTGFRVGFDFWAKVVTYERVAICVSTDPEGKIRAHQWDSSRSHHSMYGYHRVVCAKCGFVNEYDSSG